MSHKKPPITPAERAQALAIRDRLVRQVCVPIQSQPAICLECGHSYTYIQWAPGFCRPCRKVRK